MTSPHTTSPLHLTPEQLQDPVAAYGELRTRPELPSVVLPGMRIPTLLVTRYAEVKAALTEPRLVRDPTTVPGLAEEVAAQGGDVQGELMDSGSAGLPPEYATYLSGHLGLFDGEDHARRRAPLTRAFTARRITALRPFVERHCARLLDDLAARRGSGADVDLLHDLAYPLATSVICELVGVDEEDRPRVREWIRDFAYGDGTRAVEGLTGIVEYVRALIGRRRAEPTGDLISALVADGGTLTEDEAISVVFLLIDTGITPPALFLAHAALALFDHPDQLARLRAEPELLATAVPELLRWVSLVRVGMSFYAREDFTFAGTALRRGASVTVGLLAANHDPREYGEGPERLDLARAFGRGDGHMAFGHGPHYCLGAALGRLVTGVFLDQVFVRRPATALAVDREALEFGHWPADGFHLLALPVVL
ncbi:cytochrome P450 [Streptomyces sp. NPDC057638]|uniref:cytochrome P450 n=1 Tax=Streptomyces sp. NPDC057638 TaxID=3346190 RepID=UPI00368684BD